MTGVIDARAKQTGVSYAAMEKTYLDRVSLRRMVTARDVAATVTYLLSAAGANISGPIACRRRQCRSPLKYSASKTKGFIMAANNKVIITCAVTGAIHTPSMSPHLPVTPDEIASAAIGSAEAGAAIIHLDARDPATCWPDQSPEAFARFLPRIKQATKAVVNLTTGGAPYMTVQERVKPAETFKPEVASLNMGSMNFGLFPMLNRFKDFKHEWERQALENSRDLVFRNTLQGH